MKQPVQSRTIQTAVTLATAAVVSLILHYTGVIALTPAALGAAYTALISSAIMTVLRLVTREPIGYAESQDGAEETEE